MRKYEHLSHKRKGRSLLMIVLFVILLVFGVLLLSKPVSADEHVFYIKQLVGGDTLMCDTKEQIKAILVAHAEGGFNAGHNEYHKYLHVLNDYREPMCREVEMVEPVLIEELIFIFDGLVYPNGVYTQWVVRVTATSGKTFFITVNKPVKEKEEVGEYI